VTTIAAAPVASRLSRTLADRIGRHKFEMWFGQSARLTVKDADVEVAADSPFVADWIDGHFRDDLMSAAREALGADATIHVRVAPQLPDREDAAAHGDDRLERHRPRSHAPARRGPHGPAASGLRRLEDFVVGPSNRLAFAEAVRLAESADRAACSSPLFIHGECGVGKTHLLQGVCRRALDRGLPSPAMRYVTGEQFTNEYIGAVRGGSLDAFRRRVRRLELLAIDDVHFLSNKIATQSEFLHTLDSIDLGGARVVLASDEHPRHIKRFSQALVSRFLSGMVVEVTAPTRETRREIIARLAAERGLRLSEPAAEALAARLVGSVRELEGAVTKLAALHDLAHRADAGRGDVGLILAEQLLQDASLHPRTPVRIAQVIDVVCSELAVHRADLVGSGRHRRVVLARALVAHLGRELTTMSYPEIARALGRDFHSTIHTADQRLRHQLADADAPPVDIGGRTVPLTALVDQLRHQILRAAVAA
jgi:chromosomal replication initiator protein